MPARSSPSRSPRRQRRHQLRDIEALTPAAHGCVLRMPITEPANWRATQHLGTWLKAHNLIAISHVDTRRLTRRIRDGGAPRGALIHCPGEAIEPLALRFMAEHWPGLEGMDLAKEVTCRQTYQWNESRWSPGRGYGRQTQPRWHRRRRLRRQTQHPALSGRSGQRHRRPRHGDGGGGAASPPGRRVLSNGPGDPRQPATTRSR